MYVLLTIIDVRGRSATHPPILQALRGALLPSIQSCECTALHTSGQRLESDHFHRSISHRIFMCIVSSENMLRGQLAPRDAEI